MGGFAQFIWNGETKRFCGRSCRSWCEIAAYYLFYYMALTAFYSASICAFYQLISPSQPSLLLKAAIHHGNPGMGFRPSFPKLGTTLIHRSKAMQEFNVKSIDNFIEKGGYAVKDGTASGPKNCDNLEEGEICEYDIYPADMGECWNNTNYGYTYDSQGNSHGTPCVLLKLNQLYDWTPELLTEVPEDLKGGPTTVSEEFLKNYIPVLCRGESAHDIENIEEIQYHPAQGFGKIYFPYKRQMRPKKYQQPFIFARIKTTPGVVVYVECIAYAKNIEYDGAAQETRKGSVHFELLADE